MRRAVPPLILTLCTVTPALAGDGWVQYSEKDDVTSYSKALEGSNLLSTRGVATIQVPLCQAMGMYLDTKRAPNWVNLMVRLDATPIAGSADVLERHVYDMPWPVSDREFVFKRTTVWEDASKTVTVTYHSVEDAKYPHTEELVRGIDHGSFWKFTVVDATHTRVEAVAMVDPQGALPSWLFNSVQRAWPRDSIHGLVAEVAKGHVTPRPECAGW
jgi:hypothetical protein